MAMSTVTVFSVNSSTGANLTALNTTTTDNNGHFSLSIAPQSGPVRITVEGGTFDSEMNDATIASPGEVSVLASNAGSSVSGISVNPLSTLVDSRTVGLLGGGSSFSPALSTAKSEVKAMYGLSSNPDSLAPDYTVTGTDAANLGLVLGAIINEDQYLCPASPGGLVTALASDFADGIFDGKGSDGKAVSYCGGDLPAIAGTVGLQDALSALAGFQDVTKAFAFGGTGNILTTNGLADIANNGGHVYPIAPLATINSAIPKGAPAAVNTFASSANTATMSFTRDYPSATLLPNGKVLIAGGFPGGAPQSSTTELYDPASDTFSPGPSMNVGHLYSTTTLLPNGKVLIAGGVDKNGHNLASTELYDPVSNTFAAAAGTASMNTARAIAMATLLPNGKVLIAGGYQSGVGFFTSTELYDPASNTFAASGSTASMNHGYGYGAATVLPNGKVLILGNSTTTELYNPATNTFAASSATASLTKSRQSPTVTLLPNGKVLIAGGNNGIASSDLYDPASNAVTAGPSMNVGRGDASATLLPNGKVLIAGGLDANGSSLTSTELYDPASNTFAASGATVSMNVDRRYCTITLLPNGEVLLAGGNDTNGDALATTELYTP